MAKIIEQYDKLGRRLTAGQCVAFSHHNELKIGVVTKLCPIMVGITELSGKTKPSTYHKYPSDMVTVEGPEVTMYCLKHGK